ncbi:PHP domain-containing protein [Aquihabitans sp. G128]|uniref:PHP domain-containing protein n=1 Tax=Aquihabitans sp. G128 TaxID=2849779 RepID=UPI001C237D33|nr:PHP domain-containing protein [Aquihabitans sp. G128]QXC63207.1 PHP domain-containing protein [Aquihabitans sp. G128]
MEPIEALERVVYLQDRGLLPSQKTAAFLKAAEIIRELPEGELEQRLADGTLTELAGIGKSTAEVITQAASGIVPKRIVDLEASTQIPLGPGADIRAAIKGDLHSHSTWSDGGASVETMARTAMGLGHEYLVMTDHSPRLTIAHGLNRERLLAQLDEIAELNERLAPFRILTGIEVDILADGGLDQDPDLLAQLDLVVASVHSKMKMEPREMTERMVLAIASPHVDVLGHCTGRKVSGFGEDQRVVRAQSAFDPEIVFAACARFDTAVEINCRPERQDPPPELLDLALDWDCKISIDTDSHAPGQLEFIAYGCDKAAEHGIDPSRIINTWSAEDLLAWTATHPTS